MGLLHVVPVGKLRGKSLAEPLEILPYHVDSRSKAAVSLRYVRDTRRTAEQAGCAGEDPYSDGALLEEMRRKRLCP